MPAGRRVQKIVGWDRGIEWAAVHAAPAETVLPVPRRLGTDLVLLVADMCTLAADFAACYRPVMTTWIAFLRGINVGGNNKLPMKDLLALLTPAGFPDVKSYIQSGNLIFRSATSTAPQLAKRISAAVLAKRGFQPHVLVLNVRELARAVASNPFPDAEADPRSLHLYFLAESPTRPDVAALNRIKSKAESFAIDGKVFYLHAPEGIGRSKLAAQAEKLIGVEATARNWRTVSKVLEMASQLG